MLAAKSIMSAPLQSQTEALYTDLKRIAGAQMRRERGEHTLSATALVHEAYLRLAGGADVPPSRAGFLAAAANLMRQILVDHARARLAEKRGGDWARLTLTTALGEMDLAISQGEAAKPVDLLALDDALNALAALDARQAEMVVLRYFGGLSIEETAASLGCSIATVKRDWLTAKLFLKDRLA
jgi:RNA polymerase sigma factor (TIGR02999 family)